MDAGKKEKISSTGCFQRQINDSSICSAASLSSLSFDCRGAAEKYDAGPVSNCTIKTFSIRYYFYDYCYDSISSLRRTICTGISCSCNFACVPRFSQNVHSVEQHSVLGTLYFLRMLNSSSFVSFSSTIHGCLYSILCFENVVHCRACTIRRTQRIQ